MPTAAFQTLIKEFGAKLGASGVEADDEGYVGLSFDDHPVHLQYDAETDEIVVFARLGEIDDDRTEEICLMLLGANLFWQGTKGATFSVEPATGVVFLADRRAMDSTGVDGLNSWLERFLDVAAHWRGRLELANVGGSLGTGDPALPPPGPTRPGDFIRG